MVLALVQTGDLAMETVAVNIAGRWQGAPGLAPQAPHACANAIRAFFGTGDPRRGLAQTRLVLTLTLKGTCFTKYLSTGSNFDVKLLALMNIECYILYFFAIQMSLRIVEYLI